MYPCVSGVVWNMSAGNVDSGDSQAAVARITGAYAADQGTVFWAGAGSRSDLYHVSFEGLAFCTANDQPVPRCPGPVNNIRLNASSRTVTALAEAQHYTLSITPDNAITIGGAGVLTDLIATGDSTITVPLAEIPVGALGCAIAGADVVGSILSGNCRVRVSAFQNLNWLIGGSDFSLIGLDLDFVYLATHRNDPTDPYTQPPVDGSGNPLDSIRLPNTTISVS